MTRAWNVDNLQKPMTLEDLRTSLASTKKKTDVLVIGLLDSLEVPSELAMSSVCELKVTSSTPKGS